MASNESQGSDGEGFIFELPPLGLELEAPAADGTRKRRIVLKDDESDDEDTLTCQALSGSAVQKVATPEHSRALQNCFQSTSEPATPEPEMRARTTRRKRIIMSDDDDSVGIRTPRKSPGAANTTRAPDVVIDLDEEDGAEEFEDWEEPETEQEEVDRLLQQCEELSSTLKGPLQKARRDDGCVVLTSVSDIQGGGSVVKQPSIVGNTNLRLKEYQVAGLTWLSMVHDKGLNGCLADEMGLGKTVQVIAFLGHLLTARGNAGPHLIIVPGSTLSNWGREFKVWLPSVTVLVYHGSAKEREQMRAGWNMLSPHVVLTTYSYFQGSSASAKADRSFLRKFSFEFLVLDEAQNIKDANSSRYKAIQLLQCKHRLLLTGTPVNNNLNELFVLLNFLMPHLFNKENEHLQESFEIRGNDEEAVAERERLIQRVKQMTSAFVLRRRKQDVLTQLTPKVAKTRELQMTEAQRLLYDELLRGFRNQHDTKQQQHMFTQLRKAANHPLLVRSRYTDDMLPKLAQKLNALGIFGPQSTQQLAEAHLSASSDAAIGRYCAEYSSLHHLKLESATYFGSAKVQCLEALLPQLKADGHRVLLFSQWTSMMDILELYLQHRSLRYLRLDGSTPVSDRQELMDRFTSDSTIFIFLLSTRAGGVGINLTAADTVVLHDVDFNPQVDRQAEDRCHRIGQTKSVTVFKLVAQGTVDQHIYNLAERKRRLADETLDEADGDAQSLQAAVAEFAASLDGGKPSGVSSSVNGLGRSKAPRKPEIID